MDYTQFINNETVQLIGNIIGYFGSAFFILSFIFKHGPTIIVCQSIGSFLFLINMIFIGSINSAIINGISIFRGLVLASRKHRPKFWLYFFILINFVPYILTFTVFSYTLQQPIQWYFYIIEILPIIGMCLTAYGFFTGHGDLIRKIGFIDCPLWIMYYIFMQFTDGTGNMSVAGVICDCFMLASAITMTIYYKHKDKKESISKEEKNN